MIDRRTVDEIYNKADIVEVVSEFVSLRKAGTNYKGLCPFHNEKTPSFMVSPSKGICHCFSCGKGGNVVHFLMEHEQMNYPEALRWLAKKYGITIEETEMTAEEREARGKRDSLFIVNEWANQYFQNNLYNTEEGQTYGLNYFRSRGLRDDIIKKFQLGYCMNKADSLSHEAIKQGYKEEYLIETGLCFKRDNGTLYDKYHSRVIYPVHSLSGKVVAFGGRILSNDKKQAKYINSPESDIYHKSYELYGIHQAKRSITAKDRCYLVEGYMDVISMHQCGIENVVASSGTSLTEGQIRMIHRFTNNITVLYDGDAAGIHASLRGINMLLAEGMNIKVLLLPDGDDPDSFARKHNAEEYQMYMEEHQEDFITFKVRILLADAKNDLQKRSEVVNDIIESIALIPDAITRSVYIQECSRMLNMQEEVLIRQTARKRKLNYEQKKQENTSNANNHDNSENKDEEIINNNSEPISSSPSPVHHSSFEGMEKDTSLLNQVELQLMRILIRYGERIILEIPISDTQSQGVSVIEYVNADFSNDDITFSQPFYQQILTEGVEHCHEDGFNAANYFISNPNVEISRFAAQMISNNYQLSSMFDKGPSLENKLPTEVPQLILKLKLCIVSNKVKELLQKMQSLPTNSADYQSTAGEYIQYLQMKKELAKQCGETSIRL